MAAKLKVQLPIDGKALRRESKQLRGEVESLLPRLDEMKTEMDQLSRIRSHIRKVMPGVLEARDEEDRRTFADYTEQQANQQELDELLQRTADQAIAHGSADDAPEQPEVIPVPTRSKGAQSHDEAR